MLISLSQFPLPLQEVLFDLTHSQILRFLEFLRLKFLFFPQQFCLLPQRHQIVISLFFQQLKTFSKLLQRDESLTHSIVCLQVSRRILDGYLTVLNNLPVIFILEVDCCSIGMQLGTELIVIALLLDGLSVLLICVFHVIRTIGSLLQSLICLFLGKGSIYVQIFSSDSGILLIH